MKKPNKKYWIDRAVQLEQAIQNEATPTVENIKRAYEAAIRNINSDMRNIFCEFARASGISEDDAKKLINAHDSNELYKDLLKLYNETEDGDARREIAVKINRQAYGARLSRLEALKEKIYIHLMQAKDTENEQHKALHAETFKRSYYSNIHNIAKGFDVGINFAVLPKRAIDAALSADWLGSNYSKRIWNNNEQFIEKVQQTITDGITAGHSIDRMFKQLLDYVTVEGTGQRYIAERLVRTETAHFMAEGQLEAYKEAGIEKYQFVAALSERTCDQCGGFDGEIFSISEARPGDNYPPIHANCRCTTVLAGFDPPTRIARNPETEKNYKVDGSMTYNKWMKGLTPEQKQTMKYVDKSVGSDIIKPRNVEMAVNDVHYIGKLNKNIYQCVTKDIQTDDVIITDTQIKHIKERHPNDYERFSEYFEEIIREPDYIIEANKPNSALILKHVDEVNEQFKTVLRLSTYSDNSEIKNSIITFIKIDEKEWNRLTRNKKILYKSE